jgi:uncharacterized protein YbjT (DUF2867 family)
MKALVVGASGGMGRAMARALRAAGHHVRLLARDPSSLDPAISDIITGDVMDAATVARAVAGMDMVFVTLGVTRGKATAPDVCATGTANVIAAMQAEGIRRLLVVTSMGLGSSARHTPLLFRILFATILKAQFDDKKAQEAAVMASGLDWTLVRPVGLRDDPPNGRWIAAPDRVGQTRMSRDDVAAAMLTLATEGRHIGEAVIVSGG